MNASRISLLFILVINTVDNNRKDHLVNNKFEKQKQKFQKLLNCSVYQCFEY
jgi:hypothetical protein